MKGLGVTRSNRCYSLSTDLTGCIGWFVEHVAQCISAACSFGACVLRCKPPSSETQWLSIEGPRDTHVRYKVSHSPLIRINFLPPFDHHPFILHDIHIRLVFITFKKAEKLEQNFSSFQQFFFSIKNHFVQFAKKYFWKNSNSWISKKLIFEY